MATYDQFTAAYVSSLAPVGEVERQLANACADLQFRLHRLAAAEHNLLAIGHDENGNLWNTGHPESHTALTLAETFRRSKDPLATSTLYETRLSRRFLQTLKQLHQLQAERKHTERQQLEEMYAIAQKHPGSAEILEPAQFGFVCSTRDWKLYFERCVLLDTPKNGPQRPGPRQISREVLRKAA